MLRIKLIQKPLFEKIVLLERILWVSHEISFNLPSQPKHFRYGRTRTKYSNW